MEIVLEQGVPNVPGAWKVARSCEYDPADAIEVVREFLTETVLEAVADDPHAAFRVVIRPAAQ